MNGIVLMEASSSTKKKYAKKYKCPYCDLKFERAKLHIHIQNKHEDLIPEGYTALRVAFNTINNKDHGTCIICGNESPWNEDKGRYERLCGDPKCTEAYKKMAAERNKKKYGSERLQTDPRYKEEVERKALAGRKISGEYTFKDGGKIKYVGSYERKCLEFMDLVMHCESIDIQAPGPGINYAVDGTEHLYLPDFYYTPYNLIIEIKDGGDNPNNNPAIVKYKQKYQAAKEKAVEDTGKYNYVKVTNNDFSQLMKAMAVIKYRLDDEVFDPVIMINESALYESTDKSILDKNYKSKGSIKLSDLKLKSRQRDDEGKSLVLSWYKDEEFVATVLVDTIPASDGYKWFGSFRISKKFRGYGLSDQIIDLMISPKYGAGALSVHKDNEIAINLYKKHGFEISKTRTDKEYYFMYLKKNKMNATNESAKKKYDPPMTYEEIVKKMGKEKADELMKDPVHRWRAETGIELIHREPSLKELNRIWENWNLMTSSMMKKSDTKSYELFKMNNKDHYNALVPEYKESTNESYIINEPDIYYNKEAFDNGDINLCFITGLSGSGKSTMARGMSKVESYELDDVTMNWNFSDENLKEYGDLIYSFFNTHKEHFRYHSKEECFADKYWDNKDGDKAYEVVISKAFIEYAMKYAKSHKNTKYVVEGVEIFWSMKPEELKDYAVYIKGTSMLKSKYRATKRDSADAGGKLDQLKYIARRFVTKNWKHYIENEKLVDKYRDYYQNLMKKDSVNESYIVNEPDIYYNKKKFDKDEINLCFITGHSGSGKSTMSSNMKKKDIETYSLDDLMCVKDHFTMDQLKEYGDLIYSYFVGPGKEFYRSYKELVNDDTETPASEYEDKMFPGFVHYSMQYAKSHKNTKFIVEGVWLFGGKEDGSAWFKPSEFNDYAFYIKGTSMIVSKHRAAVRDAKEDTKKDKAPMKQLNMAANYIARMLKTNWKWYILDERNINVFRDYFKKKMEKEVVKKESMAGAIGSAIVPSIPESTPYEADKRNYYFVQHLQNNVFNYGITNDPTQHDIYSIDPENGYKVFKADKNKFDNKYLVFKMKNQKNAKKVYDEMVEAYMHGNSYDCYDAFYEHYTDGDHILDEYTVLFDDRFELVRKFDDIMKEQSDKLYNDLIKDPISILEDQCDELENGMYSILDPSTIHNINDLEKWKTSFDSLHHDLKMRSNDMAKERYGIDNIDLYNKIKNDIYSNCPPPDNLETRYVGEDGSSEIAVSNVERVWIFDNLAWKNIIDKLKLLEKMGYLFIVDLDVYTTINNYGSASIDKIQKKYEKFLSLPENKRVLNDTTLKNITGYGNYDMYNKIINYYSDRLSSNLIPTIPYEDNKNNTIELVKQDDKVQFSEYSNILKDSFDIFTLSDMINEGMIDKSVIKNISETMNIEDGSGEKLRPVFTVCLLSESLTTKVFHMAMPDAKYWHAAIGFGPSLNVCYSFNMGHYTNAFKGGLNFEGINEWLDDNKDCTMQVNCIFLSMDKFNQLRKTLNYYIYNKNKTGYDVINLVKSLFEKARENGLNLNQVCSSFVDTLLKSIGVDLSGKAASNTAKPDDFQYKETNKNQFKLYEGRVDEYNANKVLRFVQKLAKDKKNDYFYQ